MKIVGNYLLLIYCTLAVFADEPAVLRGTVCVFGLAAGTRALWRTWIWWMETRPLPPKSPPCKGCQGMPHSYDTHQYP